MMKKFPEPPYKPVNASEHMLHGILIRIDALCHMMNSLIEHVAERDGVATTSTEEVITSTKEVKEIVEAKQKPKAKGTRK